MPRQIHSIPSKRRLGVIFLFLLPSLGLLMGSFLLSFYTTLSPPELQVSDHNATQNTKDLFFHLADLTDQVLFGHQDTNFYGLDATDPDNLTIWSDWDNFTRSDVFTLTGFYPAVYGFDIFNSTTHIIPGIKAAFERGGVITVSWHATNFVTGGSFYDTTGNVVSNILPGGSHHINFTQVLDNIAENLGNLEHLGESVPIIFRPWHEYNGDWFWWCQPFCAVDEFKALYRFTVEYLRDLKGVHNFLYCISPNQPLIPFSSNMYFERYPGNDVIDIFALDAYHSGESVWKESISSSLRTIIRLAFERGKIAAFSETGLGGGLSETHIPNWYSDILLDVFLNDPLLRNVAYVMVWRNANFGHFWVPYPDHNQSLGFIQFYLNEHTIFSNNLPDMYSSNPIALNYNTIAQKTLICHNLGAFIGLVVVSGLLVTPAFLMKTFSRRELNDE
ncbi:MAG: hypothetical protein JW776_05970 [Candidatus Lokiarchaeota archaeon]|nr:hypothetical protein [Candidatus Lokiarchaeota archaeon]